MTARRLVALALLLGSCAPEQPLVVRDAMPRDWKPMRIALLYPQLAPGAVDASAALGARPLMGAEAAAVAHAAMREALARLRPSAWVDPAADPALAKRAGPLGAAIQQGWWANGAPEPRLVTEVGRNTRCDGVLIVELYRLGPSARRLAMRGMGTGVRALAGPPGEWISCGTRLGLARAPGGQLVWEAAALECRPRRAEGDQEAAIRAAVNAVMARFPRR